MRNLARRPLIALIALATFGCVHVVRDVRADVFVLTGDGQVEGELLNRDESPREKYIVRTASGATITLARDQVKRVQSASPEELEFEKIRPTFADTPEDQWKLAEWCREKNLVVQRRAVLQRIIELDPNHKPARMGLGYSQLNGRWIKPDDAHQEEGYVRYRGKWLTKQEVELVERREAAEKAVRDWRLKLQRLRAALNDSSKAEDARKEIRAINDPYAVDALIANLGSDRIRANRALYVEALGRIGTHDAMKALVAHSLSDADEEIRLSCLDQLIARSNPDITSAYVAELRSKDNTRINRAAFALGQLKDKSAIPALIEALVTTHKVKIQSGGPNSISAGFGGPGGGGLSVGSKVQIQTQNRQNQHVLDALVSLSGGMNFNFNKTSWKNWYASQSKPADFDFRRD